jgi:V8-like Glu-specific endopeptidase
MPASTRIAQLGAMVNTATGRGRPKTAMTLVGRQSASRAMHVLVGSRSGSKCRTIFAARQTPKPPIATRQVVLY